MPLNFPFFRGIVKCISYQIQNSLARAVVKAPKFTHTTLIVKSLHWLKINECVEYKIISLTFKLLTDWLTGLFRCNKRTSTLVKTNQNKLTNTNRARRWPTSLMRPTTLPTKPNRTTIEEATCNSHQTIYCSLYVFNVSSCCLCCC